MKNKKVIIISAILTLIIVSVVGIYLILNKRDKNTTLTLIDKQWIENNKNNLIDIEITNDIPIFNYNGEGVFFDFLTSFEENIGIEFNRVAIKPNSENTYAFKIVDKVDKDDIFIYQDNYALVSKSDIRYSNLDEIKNVTIGVLESDLERARTYLKVDNNINLVTYTDFNSLLSAITINNDDATMEAKPLVSGIIILKNLYMDDILKNDLFINYNLSDFTKDYVFTLGNIDKLNSIIKKYYNKWYMDNYLKSYYDNFANNYFLFEGIAERERVDFVSKRYSYGFVEEAPYNLLIDDNLVGINATILRDFSKIANIEISFENFSNRDALLNRFNENKIDFYLDDLSNKSYDMDVKNTISTFNENIVYISHINNNIVINSINSLQNYKVKAIKGSIISKYLEDNNIDVKNYDNISELLASLDKKSVIAMNKETYNYYVRSLLKDYKIIFEDYLESDYTFVVRDITDNEVFYNFFNFYLSFIDEKAIINNSYVKLINTKSRNDILFNIFIYLFAIIGLFYVVSKIISLLLRGKRKKQILSKEHKLKYVDMLTSLKNRNYLNDNIEKWDSSAVYPQTIIVIDLNNVAYINDNYGHQEGDALIKEAANILIKTQIANTEIIRTNGNEFLVYMVGYDEKQVISYIRKLNKEFKELAHGFGAAIGYSIINDAIKTIDDAVNEATLDMRNNKEEIQN